MLIFNIILRACPRRPEYDNEILAASVMTIWERFFARDDSSLNFGREIYFRVESAFDVFSETFGRCCVLLYRKELWRLKNALFAH